MSDERSFYILTRHKIGGAKRPTLPTAPSTRATSIVVADPSASSSSSPRPYVHPQTCIIANTHDQIEYNERYPDPTQSHQRRFMQQSQPQLARQSDTLSGQIDQLIAEAQREALHYVIIISFIVVPKRGLLLPCERGQKHGEYELESNEYEPRLLTRQELFLATLKFPATYRQIEQVCSHLDSLTPLGIDYMLYNRRIDVELLEKGKPAEEEGLLAWLRNLLPLTVATRPHAQYYSVIVNLTGYTKTESV